MAYFSTLNAEDRNRALGTDQVDASNGVLFGRDGGNRRPLSLQQQYLIIGLGGSGCKTVDRIKGDLKRQYTWGTDRVAFLAIDTDNGELSCLKNLEDREKYCIHDAPIIEDRHNLLRYRDSFTLEWIHPNFYEHFDSNGAGQNRGICHAKMFDGMAGEYADQKLIAKIRQVDAPFSNAMVTQVIIILGVACGTGSGGIINIAHFVHEALRTRIGYYVTGFFYMPDVFKVPAYTNSKKANGYAALKELDYYQSARQRTETDLLKSHGTTPVAVNQHNPLYDSVYLVSGSVGGMSVDSYNMAINAVKKTIVSQLVEDQDMIMRAAYLTACCPLFMTGAFRAHSEWARRDVLNSGYTQNTEGKPTGKERAGFFGEDVHNYNAIGVATASLPSELIKSYAVDRVVKNVLDVNSADGAPGTAVARAIKWGDGALPSTAGKAEIGKLLTFTPGRVKEIIRNRVTLQLSTTLRSSIIRDDALAGTAGAKILNNLGLNNGNNAKVSLFLNQVQNDVDQAYATFEKELTNFLKKYGPSAFRSMYEGVGSDQPYEGISSVLNQYKAVGRNSVKLPQNTDGALKEKRDELAKPILGCIPYKLGNWIDAFVNNEKTKLVYDVAGGIYGPGNYYDTHFLTPVRKLCEECCEFALVLEGLIHTYGDLAHNFEDFTKYDEWLNCHAPVSVYDCLRSYEDHNWAKQCLDARLDEINCIRVRDDLVDAFMDNRQAWIEYDAWRYDSILSPRKTFDTLIAPTVRFTEEVNLVSFMEYKVSTGASLDLVAADIVRGMLPKSQPLFEANSFSFDINRNCERYLQVPSALFSGGIGPAVRTALKNACYHHDLTLCESLDVDELVMLTQRSALPIYALSGLEDWEFAYNASSSIGLHRNESGRGDFNPETGLEWRNYPSLTYRRNPRLLDRNGGFSMEGQFLLKEFDPIWKEAVELGIIHERQDANGKYYYEYYNLVHEPAWDLGFNPNTWPTDGIGTYVEGEGMYAYLAEKNHCTLADITKRIHLEGQGIFSEPNPNRDIALDFAKRSLRKNVPMYLQVKKTLHAVKAITARIHELQGN